MISLIFRPDNWIVIREDNRLKKISLTLWEERRTKKKKKDTFFEHVRARARRDRFYVLETFVCNALTLHAPIDMSSAVFYLFVLKVVFEWYSALTKHSACRGDGIFSREWAPPRAKKVRGEVMSALCRPRRARWIIQGNNNKSCIN